VIHSVELNMSGVPCNREFIEEMREGKNVKIYFYLS
jgi:hypothetical protein